MKKSHPAIKGCFAAAAMGMLILDSRTAAAGAQKGVILCIETVIPSLFPFLVFSALLTGSISRSTPLLKPLHKVFRTPSGTDGMLMVGFLGGYPVGAQCVSQAFERGRISRRDAERMLVICNNCGPAFLFGMAAAVFDRWYIPWCLWCIQALSALITAWIIPGSHAEVSAHHGLPCRSITEVLQQSLRVMASVCAWVVLFRVLITFLEVWLLWLLPTEVQCGIIGILELSNGCFDLVRIDNTGLRFIMCAGALNFGGLCVLLQTLSVVSNRLDTRIYFPGKVFQGCMALLLSGLVQLLIFSDGKRCLPSVTGSVLLLLIIVLTGAFLRKSEKKFSIYPSLSV